MDQPKTSTYGRALALLAACPYLFDGRVIFDPNVNLAPGITPGPRDPDAGFDVTEVPKDTKPETVGTFMIFGHVIQTDLGIPPAVFIKGGEKYVLDPNQTLVAYDNVGNLDAQYALLDESARAGHPLGNREVHYGTNLVAFADQGSNVAVLIWSAAPYNQRQVSSMGA